MRDEFAAGELYHSSLPRIVVTPFPRRLGPVIQSEGEFSFFVSCIEMRAEICRDPLTLQTVGNSSLGICVYFELSDDTIKCRIFKRTILSDGFLNN